MNHCTTSILLQMIPALKHRLYYLNQLKTSRINTLNYKCDRHNNQQKSVCLQKYISYKLDCRLPWYSESISNLEECFEPNSLQEYKMLVTTLQLNISSRDETVCFKENCEQFHWITKELETSEVEKWYSNNITQITYKVPSKVTKCFKFAILQSILFFRMLKLEKKC